MKIFGVYNGHVYMLVGKNSAQGFCSYREYTVASSYNPDGTFAFILNNLNMDVNLPMSENHYRHLPVDFRGLQSILISPDGNIIPQVRFAQQRRGEPSSIITRYSHGYIQTAKSQWYGEDSKTINAFVAMLKFYEPKEIDQDFLDKIRYIEDVYEYFNIYKISVEKFLNVLEAVQQGTLQPQEAEKEWECTEVVRPMVINKVGINDLRPFHIAEVVYWDSLDAKELAPKETVVEESPTEPVKTEKVETLKRPKLQIAADI